MNVKHGFSTLNRFLGKKNKDKNLSKSSTNLSLSSSNHIDTASLSSHLQTQNRITPLPAATSNAPFEQTFRITVLLPQNQLYVARLGAKIKLEKLLELVCENKQLDSEIYEFRHPIDTSQVFNLELTIGSVGLTEIRLCHKSETYDNFNADEIIKLRHQTVGRDSLSSSEFSSRNSKHTKTASPYSSTNSLNSIDSTGMNTNYRGPLSLPSPMIQHQQLKHQPPIAPARKKRVAPRPPVQNVIPEKEVVVLTTQTNGHQLNNNEMFKQPLPRKDHHYVSTPNLANSIIGLQRVEFHHSNASIDCNGNSRKILDHNLQQRTSDDFIENQSEDVKGYDQLAFTKKRPQSMLILNREISVESTNSTLENGSLVGSVRNLSSVSSIDGFVKLPEPSPRNCGVGVKKKLAAPAPPPRTTTAAAVPVATPRVTTNASAIGRSDDNCIPENEEQKEHLHNHNVSKVMLNQSVEDEEEETNSKHAEFYLPQRSENRESSPDDTQADSGIGEPIPSPLPEDSLPPSDGSHCDESIKSAFESSSSDEDEHAKVYNLRLGKTIVKEPIDLDVVATKQVNMKVVETKNDVTVGSLTTTTTSINNIDNNSVRSNSPNWTYTIPAPPKFADADADEPPSSVQSESSSTESACDDIHLDDDQLYKEKRKMNNDKSIGNEMTAGDFEMNEKNQMTEIKNVTLIGEVFKKCKPAASRKSEILLKSSEPPHENTTIINSDTEDGYHGNRIESTEEQLNSKNLEKTQSYNDVKEQQETMVHDFVRHISSDTVTSKADVITELQSIICEKNGFQEIIKRNDELDEDIESAGPCNLSNFKISTYSPPSSPIKTLPEKSILKLDLIPDIIPDEQAVPQSQITLNEPPIEPTTPTTPTTDAEDEKLYKKRTSLTSATKNIQAQFAKTRRSITRSDSFHSTARQSAYSNCEQTSPELTTILTTSRSSSFLSLLAAQKQDNSNHFKTTNNLSEKFLDTNRVKSSSELSIGESPSLQSLIVMKSILNLRKSSLNNAETTETDGNNSSNKLNLAKSVSNRKSDLLENGTENEPIVESPKNTNMKILNEDIMKLERTNSNDHHDEKSDDQPEKKWKYQGPPSINLSTWSERPNKIQPVTIKNEGDYIFGGGNIKSTTSISTIPRNYRNSLPAGGLFPVQSYNNNSALGSQSVLFKTEPKVPFVRSVEYKKMNSPTPPTILPKPNESTNTEDSQPISFSTGTAMTLGRIGKLNRNSINNLIMPTVKGFQSLDYEANQSAAATTATATSTTTTATTTTWKSNNFKNDSTPSMNYRYSDAGFSTTNIEDQIVMQRNRKSLENSVDKIPAFAQVQLRKTGFKEKIYANPNILNNCNQAVDGKLSLPVKRMELQNQQKSAKLEIRLKTEINRPEPIVINANTNSVTTLPSPPPPPPPIIRSVVTKQNSNGTVVLPSSSQIDPRNQLLAAIRDFKKDELQTAQKS